MTAARGEGLEGMKVGDRIVDLRRGLLTLGGGGWRFLMTCSSKRMDNGNKHEIMKNLHPVLPCAWHQVVGAKIHAHLVAESQDIDRTFVLVLLEGPCNGKGELLELTAHCKQLRTRLGLIFSLC
jgi:hypothetical protein